ncbi:MAG TPA: NADH-quinone oxidoreductase subunit C [Bacteroidales bacterium]|nr:NADH-quinone oxidoreductase subunit C [Bacteroidales bacterium]
MGGINYKILPEILKLNFNGDIRRIIVQQRKRLVIHIRKEALPEIANYFLDELSYRFIIATGMVNDNGFDIIYHFSDDKTGYIINLQTSLPENNPEIESLANIINAANWIEREIHELFGIKFINHPNLTKLISEGNWKDNDHPYARKKRNEFNPDEL